VWLPALCKKYAAYGLKAHNGLDLNAGYGQFVYAAHDGLAVYSGQDGSNGNLLVLRTTEQFDYEGGQAYFKTMYGHLKTFHVKAGDQVKAGQFIAQANNTGDSTGNHLHFGLKPVLPGEKEWEWFNLAQNNGYLGAIDPTPYLVGVFNSYKASDYIALSGAKYAGQLQTTKAPQMFALAVLVASFGA
jgi:murein DD-endopeptidase MepM/ murein hydrolase activator NlpD